MFKNMRLQKVAAILMWTHLVPALWSGFVIIVGSTDRSFYAYDFWSVVTLTAYALMVVLQILFLLLFFMERLQRVSALWMLALIIAAVLTVGASLVIYTLTLWHNIEGVVFGVLLVAYAFAVCALTFRGLKRSASIRK